MTGGGEEAGGEEAGGGKSGGKAPGGGDAGGGRLDPPGGGFMGEMRTINLAINLFNGLVHNERTSPLNTMVQ